ncbi:Fe-S oxidoreductase [invertebrate metagenome]|uniref:Fe-S oxidoreductase n=1 Tax=invertebrate metagenome TaxID=1711999 RepID=A0A484H503_9ZZZZ
MYAHKEFRARPLENVFNDIDVGARDWPWADRVFLADGDAMVLPTDSLHQILDHLHARLPRLVRVSSYATPDNINRKPVEALAGLKARKLSLIYLGIESGHMDVLKRIAKGASPRGIAKAIHRAHDAGLKVSCMVILGLGGREYSEHHIAATVELVNSAPPTYLSTLQLDLRRAEMPGFMPRWEKYGSRFQPLNDDECLDEMARLVTALEPPHPIIFRSNHASNALSLGGILPKDKEALLSTIALARHSGSGLRPRSLRGY